MGDEQAEGQAGDEADSDGNSDSDEATRTVEIRSTRETTDPTVVSILEEGEIEVLGRMPWSSNGTFLVEITSGEDRVQGIYKPEVGERPLWDFPAGLWRRERASYLVSEELGWGLVPPTVVRPDAPLGIGSIQCFVPAAFDEHYFVLVERVENHPQLRKLAVFDAVTNNADRKGGHCLLDLNGRIWAIDNGLSFHEELKLRTVIWEFAGTALEGTLAEDLSRWLDRRADRPNSELAELLLPDEYESLLQRSRNLLATARLPVDPTGSRYPWPLV